MQKREIDLFIDYPGLMGDENAILRAVEWVITAQGKRFPTGDLSIAILSDSKVAEIHGDFLDDPTETDVITFPGDSAMDFAGEICVSADRAFATHVLHQTTFSEELTLYIIHGLLHLSGLDDKTDQQSLDMRAGETEMMGLLREENAIPVFEIKNTEKP